LIPLPPIPFYTKAYCRKNKLEYKTENKRVIEYLNNLDLAEYVGVHDPQEVVVLADSGYDDKNIEKTVARKGWNYLFALKKKRSVKTEKEYASTSKSKGWQQIQQLFKNHRRVKWVTVFLPKNSPNKKRTEFRIRQITGFLRHVGKAQLICSENKKRPKGRRKYLACNDMKATPRHILLAYRVRWEIEIFHKMVKMFLGFEDVATKFFNSVVSHVHWVYCAYILLNFQLPGIPEGIKSIAEKQRLIEESIRKKKLSHIAQVLSQINGPDKLKHDVQQALRNPSARQILI
jgi:ribonuclease HI